MAISSTIVKSIQIKIYSGKQYQMTRAVNGNKPIIKIN